MCCSTVGVYSRRVSELTGLLMCNWTMRVRGGELTQWGRTGIGGHGWSTLQVDT